MLKKGRPGKRGTAWSQNSAAVRRKLGQWGAAGDFKQEGQRGSRCREEGLRGGTVGTRGKSTPWWSLFHFSAVLSPVT